MRQNFRIFLVLVILMHFSAGTLAGDYLFTLQGSNTIGSKLGPQLVRGFLYSKGYRDITVQPFAENEYIVSGTRKKANDLDFAQVKIAAHGSSTGFVALEENNADIAMSSRLIKPAEVVALKSVANMKLAWVEHVIAIDGLAIMVNPYNSVQSLSIEQLAGIFTGQITNWKEVGGQDQAITLYARDEKSGTWDTFKELVLGKMPLSPLAKRFESSEMLSDTVANDPGGIGFTGLSFVRHAKLLAISDAGAEAMHPDTYTVATEDYSLSRRLFLYSPEYLDNKVIRDFIEFCQGKEGQKIVDETGFVSQNIQAFRHEVDKNAPEQYRQLSRHALRLSLNFRFDEGSPRLDNKAYRDLDRLVDYLQANKSRGLKLYLVGFSDAKKNLSVDMLLSRFRALAVKGVLLEENIDVEDYYALGSYNPVAANYTEQAKVRNGRVEVWVAESENVARR